MFEVVIILPYRDCPGRTKSPPQSCRGTTARDKHLPMHVVLGIKRSASPIAGLSRRPPRTAITSRLQERVN